MVGIVIVIVFFFFCFCCCCCDDDDDDNDDDDDDKDDPKTGKHTMCQPAPSKCTWTWHQNIQGLFSIV